MIRQRGLPLKTFIYTLILITIVIIISFGFLYFLLPSYYLNLKNKTLEKNANELEININNAKSIYECAALISDFARTNNSNVVAFDSNGMFIPELSSFFLLMGESEKRSIRFTYITNTPEEGNSGVHRIVTHKNIESGYSDYEETQIQTTQFADSGNQNILFKRESSSTIMSRTLSSEFISLLTIISTLQPIDEAKNVIISIIPYLLLLGFSIAFIAAYIFAKQLTMPILKISNAASMMQEMTPGVLSNVRTNDELGQLSNNLDSLYLKLCKNIQSLEQEMEKVAALEHSKTDLMRAAGHELKTPIAALSCIIEGMLDNVGAYKNHPKYLGECKEQVAKLSKLVNEILKSSRLEHYDGAIQTVEIDVGDVLEEAIGFYNILIDKKRIHLTKEAFSFIYNTDPHMLLNTLSNLISNAVNYTEPDGSINIFFSSNSQCTILSIENQCANIDEKLMPKLCEPFFTLSYSRHKSESGTGLGLYIVKKNLDALNLPFTIENTQTGLKFTIRFQ